MMGEENDSEISGADSKGLHSNVLSNDQSPMQVMEEEFAHFIQFNTRIYLKEFKKFNIDGVERFKITWNWSAFLFSWVWMATRKMYLLALLTFFLTWFFPFPVLPAVYLFNSIIAMFIIPNPPSFSDFYPEILFMIIYGIAGNYFYYRKVKKRILELKNTQNFTNLKEMLASLEKDGGLNRWIVIIAIPLLGLFLAYPWMALIQ